jgi:hypothetical protein
MDSVTSSSAWYCSARVPEEYARCIFIAAQAMHLVAVTVQVGLSTGISWVHTSDSGIVPKATIDPDLHIRLCAIDKCM